MNLTILATGSRGDVQPFVALAYGLQQAGHSVCMVTNAHFEAWVRSYGMDVHPIDWDAQASLQSPQGQKMVQSGGLLDGLKYATQTAPRIFAQVQGQSWQACQGAECLVYSLISPWGQPIAEKLGIPAAVGLLHPMIPTRAFPSQLVPFSMGGTFNWITHRLGEWAMWLLLRGVTNTFRSELGLTPIRFPRTVFDAIYRPGVPLLCCLSPVVIPRPADWPVEAQMHGYWFLPPPPGWQPPVELEAFIRQGPPPVYVGFGSMANQGNEASAAGGRSATTRLVVEALRLAGVRAVLARGWAGLDDLPPSADLFVVDEAPHEWLFPQMAAVVHHGGAGTTAAGLRAGVPSVIVPHMQDQPYWGRKVFELGVGPQPIPRPKLTATALANALRTATGDAALRQRAARLGEQIRKEDGLGRAVGAILSNDIIS